MAVTGALTTDASMWCFRCGSVGEVREGRIQLLQWVCLPCWAGLTAEEYRAGAKRKVSRRVRR